MSRKSRQRSARRRLKHVLPVGVAIFMLVAGLFMGTVFSVVTPLSQRPVAIEEAESVSARMQQVNSHYRRKRKTLRMRLSSISIDFQDHEQLWLENVLANETMLECLSAYPAGTVFDMLLYPDSERIIALSIGGEEIIRFDETLEKMQRESVGFFALGLFMYFCAGYGAWSLVMHHVYRRVINA